ncbi:hypothetical protein BDR04DRAFT_1156533 [Suillus decipiens]|nr:hypothetical protein BDR04DRAFT_1156533 [Suillus decipiens]
MYHAQNFLNDIIAVKLEPVTNNTSSVKHEYHILKQLEGGVEATPVPAPISPALVAPTPIAPAPTHVAPTPTHVAPTLTPVPNIPAPTAATTTAAATIATALHCPRRQ